MNLFIYRTFLKLYPAALRLVAPWNSKARRWLKGRADIIEHIRTELANSNGRRNIWMHCASLGEFEQGRPVLERLRAQYPGYQYIVTFFSPSGYDASRAYKGADHIFYLPMDSAEHAKQVTDLFDPAIVIWVKYDYWYFYLHELHERGIPVLLLSGIFQRRMAFFKWYGGIQRKMLHSISHFFVQDEPSMFLLRKLGIKTVTVSGDTRFDRVIEIARWTGDLPGIKEFCGSDPVIVAGSTWQEDEEELDHFANIHPEIKFIIAPHEVGVERIAEVEKLFKRAVKYSEWGVVSGEWGKEHQGPTHLPLATTHSPVPNVLIIDNIGLLSRLYRYATITWVGGGFGDEGVHNVLEAAVYGKPVVFGPVYDKFIEAVELVGSGGGFSVENALEAETLFTSLLIDKEEYDLACEASREYVYSNKGATEKIVAFVQENRLLTN
ncbi:MAG: glycosyltransferase N-terminal domain-containing protein [Chitinophagaceae bacterium]